MTDIVAPCLKLARELKATIDARMLGREVKSAGHRGRQMEYAQRSIGELINYYNQIRTTCPAAMADPDLIELVPPDQPTVKRGPPGVRFGRSFV